MTTDEKMPEWLNDGPTSMHDMIELRGFDDDNKIRRKSKLLITLLYNPYKITV